MRCSYHIMFVLKNYTAFLYKEGTRNLIYYMPKYMTYLRELIRVECLIKLCYKSHIIFPLSLRVMISIQAKIGLLVQQHSNTKHNVVG